MPVALVLDTDIGSDVDDALALAFALRNPAIDLRAVTTVSGDTALRARLAARLVELAGAVAEVAPGVPGSTAPGPRSAWNGHEGVGVLEHAGEPTVSNRTAAEVLVEAGAACEIATIGMQTNLAAALALEPELPARLARLAVMGGVFARTRFHGIDFVPAYDHNLNVDPGAALRTLSAGFRTLYVPCDVTVQTFLTTGHVERLRRGDELCRALTALLDVWEPFFRRTTAGRLPADHVAALHDPLALACLVERRFVTVERLPVTVALHDGDVRTFVDPVCGAPADVVRSVDAPAFADYLVDVLLG